MDRRQSLKLMTWGTLVSGVLLDACKNSDKQAVIDQAKSDSASVTLNRMEEEEAYHKKVLAADDFFTPHEMKTIAVLSDIIIPKDDVSGSATDAKVPEFIAYIVKEKTDMQTPLRGGLRWLDMQMLSRYQKDFASASSQQQIAMVDDIAYPEKAKPEMAPGVKFFTLMRNLTATGFYTTEIGYKDVGYMGNKPNQWNGVPDEVLKQYGLAYTDKELKECISFS